MKVVGSGASIRIWEDLWVPDQPSRKGSPRKTEQQNWTQRTDHLLGRVPGPRTNQADVSEETRWKLFCQSAYYVELESKKKAGFLILNLWRNLWKAEIVPKFKKKIGCRMLREALPVAEKLKL
ncbi:uncharacterized protein LOC110713457 [Chenopodium quinoa]|uniref:uncharacterized protein LOC110713457 n=1 Tax=Chenopodium quinoa TaxID=63459 RepID=UPI000B795E8E|nr:uncharacterized protein LOC110713457 [Chenopodium quinoa]